jgi:NAD(P)-dependent dehydrogenase (short-subunit alcohol dehydrogenase family)
MHARSRAVPRAPALAGGDDAMNQICLITGSTRGIGREIALGLAQRGARVVLVGRDEQRGRAVAEELRAESANREIEFLAADLSSQQSIRELATEYRRRHRRLDVLINNAGALYPRRQITVDGLERTLALNHLAYFLLTEQLLDLIKASAPARIINVASAAHARAHVDFQDLQSANHYGGLAAYRISKLENLYFTYELARRLQGTGVTVNAMHPGTVSTGLGMGEWGWFKVAKTLLRPFLFGDPRDAAKTAIYLATSPEVEGVTGAYFVDSHPERSSDSSYDRAAQARLWYASQQLTTRPSAV